MSDRFVLGILKSEVDTGFSYKHHSKSDEENEQFQKIRAKVILSVEYLEYKLSSK